uniref:Uncharacterized protein n=1 Tax=Marseillevirus LCMAC101 TaxID=2506602 RepID=A0A481YQI1_9VIRU|nr:MAG: uncharacterized protein LCMAC101_00290 [Marseillevirus LCMAC101]
MVSQLRVIKKPRAGGIPDHPINFPPLENLHLELLENKKKLKSGLPSVSPSKRPTAIPIVVTKPSEPEEEDVPEKKKKKVIHEKIDEEDEEMVSALGEDIPDEEGDEDEEDEDEEGEDEEEEEDDPYAGMTPEEREAMEKEEFIWRFRILKKKYKNPSVEIPDYNEHSDLPTMKRNYDRTIKELYLDESVETYRSYLLGSWIVMEFVSTQWLAIDLSGFTVQQTKMMHKYDSLLIELGEKSRERWGLNLPVEVRLLGFILIQAGIFYLGKIIATKFGNNVSEIFKGVTGQPSTPKETPKQSQKDKKARGPRIKASDIRKMHSKKVDESSEYDEQNVDDID